MVVAEIVKLNLPHLSNSSSSIIVKTSFGRYNINRGVVKANFLLVQLKQTFNM